MPIENPPMWRPMGGVWKDEEPQNTWYKRLAAAMD